jgi:hypothetical protein
VNDEGASGGTDLRREDWICQTCYWPCRRDWDGDTMVMEWTCRHYRDPIHHVTSSGPDTDATAAPSA